MESLRLINRVLNYNVDVMEINSFIVYICMDYCT